MGKMTEQEFKERNISLGEKFIDELVTRCKLYEDVEGALDFVDMANDNLADAYRPGIDGTEEDFLRVSLGAAADSLCEMGFFLKDTTC